MKKLAAFLLFYVVAMCLMALWTEPAHAADTGTCYTISDADARQYCLARARRDTSQCYAIQRSDLRAECLAEVRK